MHDTDGRGHVFKGISLMVLSMFLLAVTSVITKMLGQSHHVSQIVLIRNIFVMLPVGLMVWRYGGLASLKPQNITGQILRSFFQLMAATLIAASFILLPLAEADSLLFAAPLFVAFLAGPLLGERVGWRRRAAVFVGFGGVIVILRPTPELIQLVSLTGVAAALFICLRDIWTRRLRRTESTNAIMFWSELGVIVGAAPVAAWFWLPMTAYDLALMAASGVLLGVAQFTMTVAYVSAEVATVAPFRYSAIIWSVIFGYMFFGHIPDVWVITGVTIVIASGLYILHRESSGGDR